MPPSGTPLLAHIKTALQPQGFNLIGTTTATDYDRLVAVPYRITSLFPAGKTLIVIGNGGGDLWRAFQTYCAAHPNYLQGREHPLDDYTVEIIEDSLAPLFSQARVDHRYFYPFRFATDSGALPG